MDVTVEFIHYGWKFGLWGMKKKCISWINKTLGCLFLPTSCYLISTLVKMLITKNTLKHAQEEMWKLFCQSYKTALLWVYTYKPLLGEYLFLLGDEKKLRTWLPLPVESNVLGLPDQLSSGFCTVCVILGHYVLTYNMNFLVLALLLEHLSLRVPRLDMAAIDCSLDLTRALVAKMFGVFRLLELEQVCIKR